MTFINLKIHCIRDVDNSKDDDEITITPVWTTLQHSDIKRLDYSITHKVPGSETDSGNRMINTSRVYATFLEAYLSNLIKLLAVDEAPFRQIQISIPCMPCVLLTPKTAETMLPSLISELRRLMSCWPELERTELERSLATTTTTIPPPTTPTHSPITAPVARHIFFDEEDGRMIRQFY